MRQQKIAIPLNPIMHQFNCGIVIGKVSADDLATLSLDTLNAFEAAQQSHRDDYHFFILQESGQIIFEIDFKRYKINGPALIYIQPGQVHRMISFKEVSTGFLAMRTESIQPEYLQLLQEIAPARPLKLKQEGVVLYAEMLSLCVRFSERKDERLQQSILKDSSNVFIGLLVSAFLKSSGLKNKLTRLEFITKGFKAELEQNYLSLKRPAEYAVRLHLSTSYLNECVKNTTGYPVSQHIQQRIILEAKRLLYHSDLSLKEISAELGYDDYAYFSRLFAKVAGLSASAFRNKNRD